MTVEPDLPTTMRAVTRRVYGGPEVVAIEQVPRPDPGPGEVLVKVAAAGLDRATLHLLTGLPYAARAAFGLRRLPRKEVEQKWSGGVRGRRRGHRGHHPGVGQ